MSKFRQFCLLVPGLMLCTGLVVGCGSSENTVTAPPPNPMNADDLAARQQQTGTGSKGYDPKKGEANPNAGPSSSPNGI